MGNRSSEMLQRLELDARSPRKRLIDYAGRSESSSCPVPSMRKARTCLAAMDVPMYKVPSGEITNLPFLQHLARKAGH